MRQCLTVSTRKAYIYASAPSSLPRGGLLIRSSTYQHTLSPLVHLRRQSPALVDQCSFDKLAKPPGSRPLLLSVKAPAHEKTAAHSAAASSSTVAIVYYAYYKLAYGVCKIEPLPVAMAERATFTVEQVIDELDDESDDNFDGYLDTEFEVMDDRNEDVEEGTDDHEVDVGANVEIGGSVRDYNLSPGCSAAVSADSPLSFFSLLMTNSILQSS